MLQNGTKVSGKYEGQSFTGYVRELCHISTIDLDNPIKDGSDTHFTLYMKLDTATGKGPKGYIIEIPDLPGNEVIPLPASYLSLESLARQYKHVNYGTYRDTAIRHKTTYRTEKQTVTCEYGCKHKIDKRVEVRPVLDEKQLRIAFFWYALAEYVHYSDALEYQAKHWTWYQLAGKLALSALIHEGDYGDLPQCQVNKIQDELRANYEKLCDEYVVAIFGKHLDRYLASEAKLSGTNRKARITARAK